jgi:predicted TIM-barrel fold metal-dependent hydrolase
MSPSESRLLVISSDCHAGLPPERYREYLDPEFREAFDLALPIQIASTQQAEEMFLVKEINDEWRKGRDAALSGAWDHDERIKVLDGDGIAGEVIFPDGITEMNSPPFGASLGLPANGVDPKLQWAGARAHNRWLAEFCQMAPDRRCGVALVLALYDVAEAVAEVRWAKANGLRSIMIPVMWGQHPPYHHPRYEPLWDVCEELDMPIHFHSGPAEQDQYFGVWPPDPQEGSLLGGMGIYVSEVAFFVSRPLTFLIWGGVFERHPKLKVAITEGTAVWVPDFIQLLDHRYAEHHGNAKLGDYRSHMSLSPSEYFARNVRIGTNLHLNEIQLRDKIGIGTMMWGSDFPHPEGSWPETQARLDENFSGVPVDEIAAMVGGNAAEFYGFDVEKLAPLVSQIGPEVSRFEG